MSRKRTWCFTYFLSQEENDKRDWSDFVSSDDTRVRGAIWQLERCPRTERLHLQGYVEYHDSMRLSKAQPCVTRHCHLEGRKGTRDQAIAYCEKQDSYIAGPWRCGDFNSIRPGKRVDLDQVAEFIQSGARSRDVAEEYPSHYIRYRRGIEALASICARNRIPEFREVRVDVYWGDAGTGKTRKAVEDTSPNYFILEQGERVWFDGYEGEDTLIIDDFYGWIKYGQLLRILDGYVYRAEIKGGFTYAAWTRVIITSNKEPEQWYAHGLTPALSRRITNTIKFPLE